MTLEKAAEIFDALGFRVAFVDEEVVKVSIIRSHNQTVLNDKNLGLHNIYFKKYGGPNDEGGDYIYAWSGTLDHEDTSSRCYDCVPLLKLYRDVIEHNMEMLVGAGLKFRMV